jgi:hypothetical protein
VDHRLGITRSDTAASCKYRNQPKNNFRVYMLPKSFPLIHITSWCSFCQEWASSIQFSLITRWSSSIAYDSTFLHIWNIPTTRNQNELPFTTYLDFRKVTDCKITVTGIDISVKQQLKIIQQNISSLSNSTISTSSKWDDWKNS